MTWILDTHALVWYLEASPRLGKNAARILGDANCDLVIPTIVLAEVAFLYGRKRIAIDLRQVFSRIANAPNCVVYPLDESVVEHLPSALNIHDAIIVGTALVFRDVLGKDVAILSKDAEISASGLVNVEW